MAQAADVRPEPGVTECRSLLCNQPGETGSRTASSTQMRCTPWSGRPTSTPSTTDQRSLLSHRRGSVLQRSDTIDTLGRARIADRRRLQQYSPPRVHSTCRERSRSLAGASCRPDHSSRSRSIDRALPEPQTISCSSSKVYTSSRRGRMGTLPDTLARNTSRVVSRVYASPTNSALADAYPVHTMRWSHRPPRAPERIP